MMKNKKTKKDAGFTSISKKVKQTGSTGERPKKQTTVWWITGCVIALLIGFFAYDQGRPRALGDNVKVEYLGKISGGSWLPLSSSRPYDTYYYGTDVSTEELANYFDKGILIGSIPPYGDTSSHFKLQMVNGKIIDITLYLDRNEREVFGLFEENPKKHIFKIDSEDYEALKNSI